MQQSLEDKLKKLRLSGMLAELQNEPALTSYELAAVERLVNAELITKANRKSLRLRKNAKLTYPNATLSAIDYRLCQYLDQHVVDQLAQCSWVKRSKHIFIIGDARSGKSFVASAIASEVIESQIPLKCCDFSELIVELRSAAAKEMTADAISRLNKFKVLIIDGWQPTMLTAIEASLLFELIASRNHTHSFIITSTVLPDNWAADFCDEIIGQLIAKKLLPNSHQLKL